MPRTVLQSMGFIQIGSDTYQVLDRDARIRVCEHRGKNHTIDIEISSSDVRVTVSREVLKNPKPDVVSVFVGSTFAVRLQGEDISWRNGPVAYSCESGHEYAFLVGTDIFLERDQTGRLTKNIVGTLSEGIPVTQAEVDAMALNAFQSGYPLSDVIKETRLLLKMR